MRHIEALPFLFILLVVIGIVVALAFNQYRQRQELLDLVARRFQGRLEGGDLFSYPRLRLQFQKQPAVLRFIRVGKHSVHTQFSIHWPNRMLRCEVYPQDVLGGMRKLLGVEDIEIGSLAFDAAYVISGNDRTAIREVLTPAVQHCIQRLAGLDPGIMTFGSWRGIQVKWSGGTLTVTKPCYLSTFTALEEFISLSAELYMAASTPSSAGIEFVGEVREPNEGESQCQVCGEALARDLVYCSACQTPHHRECWEYFGGCSTYACGQKRFVEKRVRGSGFRVQKGSD
jgi:hypothetical protein